jgi:hypothetical protein
MGNNQSQEKEIREEEKTEKKEEIAKELYKIMEIDDKDKDKAKFKLNKKVQFKDCEQDFIFVNKKDHIENAIYFISLIASVRGKGFDFPLNVSNVGECLYIKKDYFLQFESTKKFSSSDILNLSHLELNRAVDAINDTPTILEFIAASCEIGNASNFNGHSEMREQYHVLNTEFKQTFDRP